MKVATADRTKYEARVTVEGMPPPVEQMIAAIQAAGKFQAKLAA